MNQSNYFKDRSEKEFNLGLKKWSQYRHRVDYFNEWVWLILWWTLVRPFIKEVIGLQALIIFIKKMHLTVPKNGVNFRMTWDRVRVQKLNYLSCAYQGFQDLVRRIRLGWFWMIQIGLSRDTLSIWLHKSVSVSFITITLVGKTTTWELTKILIVTSSLTMFFEKLLSGTALQLPFLPNPIMSTFSPGKYVTQLISGLIFFNKSIPTLIKAYAASLELNSF